MYKTFLLSAIMLHCCFFKPAQAQSQEEFPKYEMRAVWIATVVNIDWPSKGNYNPALQREEYIKLLDMHQRNGMNTIVMQIRPATDAFYPSTYEPWSEWLNGKQGAAPNPYYDPLEFMIEETHKRGMEFHAWFNPYRAVFNTASSSIAPDHITRKKPEWFLTYGDKKYFDPGIPAVRTYLTEVVKDVLNRYRIDAVHFDDYFYPYRIAGKEFPDGNSFKKYGHGMNKEDWRRSNVDSIIKNLHDLIREEKPWVKFGISPFGVWRNNDKDPIGSPTKGGQTNYDDLYADVLLWLRNGWIDYVTPQLYWERGHKLVAYEILLDWWAKYSYSRHLYIGHGIYRLDESPNQAWRNPKELPEQIRMLRNYPEVQGSMYFSSKSFLKNPNGWNDSLQQNYYRYKALVPIMPYLDTTEPETPSVEKVTITDHEVAITVKRLSQNKPVRGFVLYRAASVETLRSATAEQIRAIRFHPDACVLEDILPNLNDSFYYQVYAISNNNVESLPGVIFKVDRDANGKWVVSDIIP